MYKNMYLHLINTRRDFDEVKGNNFCDLTSKLMVKYNPVNDNLVYFSVPLNQLF